jgi:Spore cortex protein YabQ (Spore_YabQ).
MLLCNFLKQKDGDLVSVPVSSELWIFLWTICGGIVLGFIFDIFRIKRRILKTGIVLITIEDLLYWIFAAFIFFFTVYLFNDGQIRGYTIAGCLLGSVFYFAALSPIVLKVSVTVIDGVIRGVKFLIKIILLPVKFIIRLLRPPLKAIKKSAGNVGGKCGTFIKTETKALYTRGKTVFKKRKKRKKVNKNNKIEGN